MALQSLAHGPLWEGPSTKQHVDSKARCILKTSLVPFQSGLVVWSIGSNQQTTPAPNG